MLGKPVADFSLLRTGGSTFRLSGARGKTLVLCFYPKDNTPGPDEDEAVRPQFGVMKLKNRYARKVRGIERSTLDESGVLAREWRGVKVPGHVQEVSNFAKAL